MDENLYNDESKYREIIDLLKGLPKVDTPENFEFNLMTKINNGNFGLNTQTSGFFLSKYLLPATGLAVTLVVLFFVFYEPDSDEANPFLKEPPVLNELSAATASSPKIVNDVIIAQKSVPSTGKRKNPSVAENRKTVKKKALRVVVKPNDVISKEVVELPIDPSKSISVDEKILEKSNRTSTNIRSELVGGTSSGFGFDGFYIREKIDRKYLQAWKAKLDSIKRARRAHYQTK